MKPKPVFFDNVTRVVARRKYQAVTVWLHLCTRHYDVAYGLHCRRRGGGLLSGGTSQRRKVGRRVPLSDSTVKATSRDATLHIRVARTHRLRARICGLCFLLIHRRPLVGFIQLSPEGFQSCLYFLSHSSTRSCRFQRV